MKINKWYTQTEFVDIETGEIIRKSVFEKEYYKIKINKKIQINGNNGTITYQYECRPTRQGRLCI